MSSLACVVFCYLCLFVQCIVLRVTFIVCWGLTPNLSHQNFISKLFSGSITRHVNLAFIAPRVSLFSSLCYFFDPQAPPHVPSPLPWLGNIVAFGERSVIYFL